MEFLKDSLDTSKISDYSKGLAESSKIDIGIPGLLALVITVAIICFGIYIAVLVLYKIKSDKKNNKGENK